MASKPTRTLTWLWHFTLPGSARLAIMAVGILALSILSIPRLAPPLPGVLNGVLWLCWGVFALEWVLRIGHAARGQHLTRVLLSSRSLIDAISVLPVPIAFAVGLSPPTAWLLGALWILKLVPASSG